eukprot:scaffold32876_cov46-Cyclotella_meneghiniana.AAC.6
MSWILLVAVESLGCQLSTAESFSQLFTYFQLRRDASKTPSLRKSFPSSLIGLGYWAYILR